MPSAEHPSLERRRLLFGAAALAPALAPVLGMAQAARALSPDLDLFTAWTRLFARADDGEIYWWFFGTLNASIEGRADVPALRTEAVRVCRVTTTAEAVSVTWKEIGAYLDPVTGHPAATWTSPATGQALPVPRAFEEGVGVYTLSRAGVLSLKQRWARPWRTTASVAVEAGQAVLRQNELKTRPFPYPDGESPDITEPEAVVNALHFEITADLAAVREPGGTLLAAEGRYATLFGGAPSWMRFPGQVVRAVAEGAMHKTPASPDAFPEARARLQAVHPDYFRKGAISWD